MHLWFRYSKKTVLAIIKLMEYSRCIDYWTRKACFTSHHNKKRRCVIMSLFHDTIVYNVSILRIWFTTYLVLILIKSRCLQVTFIMDKTSWSTREIYPEINNIVQLFLHLMIKLTVTLLTFGQCKNMRIVTLVVVL